MKKLLLFAVVLLLFSCKKSNTPDLTIDPYISKNYTEDARQLLFRMLQNGMVVTDKDKPEFNQGEINKILSALQAVYNLKTRQTDSIFITSRIHVYPHISLQSIVLQVNQSTAEGQQLLAHQPSGNTGFDNLMSKYGFTFYGGITGLPSYGFVTIKAARSYNLIPLIMAYKNFSFIVSAQQDGYVGDGNDITYATSPSISAAIARIDFAVKSGDCPSGCILRHGWRYDVVYQNNIYKALFTGSY